MNTNESFGELVRDLRDDTVTLLREEVALAKTEIAENTKRIGRNAGYLVGGALVAFVALIMLLFAGAKSVALGLMKLELSPGLSEVLGYACIAIFVGIIAAAVIAKALDTLKSTSLVPEKTIQTLTHK